MLKRRIKKVTKAEARRMKGTKILVCKACEDEEVLVSMDTAAVTCGRCVQKLIVPPPAPKKKSDGPNKPRGWHFKVYFEQDGVVYSKGKIVNDAKKIAKLKKAHPPVKNTVKKRGRKNASTTK